MQISKTTYYIIFGVLGAIALALGAYFIFRKPKDDADDLVVPDATADPMETGNFSGNEAASVLKPEMDIENLKSGMPKAQIFPLQSGSQGKEVEQLQNFLARQAQKSGDKWLIPNEERGIWGENTQTRVQKVMGGLSHISQETFKNLQLQGEKVWGKY